ncbi:hypothetical protein ACIQ6V_19765 [Streptomyces sp. NPDC096198]|uniref:hypothetical protein n=1 Tax=Streptomyces sp. NPDC096198 TaxID=3366080 RepID=UPI0037F9E820
MRSQGPDRQQQPADRAQGPLDGALGRGAQVDASPAGTAFLLRRQARLLTGRRRRAPVVLDELSALTGVAPTASGSRTVCGSRTAGRAPGPLRGPPAVPPPGAPANF